MPFFANNPLNNAGVSTASTIPVAKAASSPIGLDPLFGRPTWTYVNLQRSPVNGPTPHLAQGTGKTAGNPSLPGNAAQLPGYLTDTAYFPSVGDYSPVHQEDTTLSIPKSIGVGSDGRELSSTWVPHDFTPAQHFFNQNRSAYNWQVMSFPPDRRQLLAFQQAQKYNLASTVQSARPLPSSNYFLGYQIDPNVASTIGGSGYGGGSL